MQSAESKPFQLQPTTARSITVEQGPDDRDTSTNRHLHHVQGFGITVAALCRLNDAQHSAFQDITNISNERRQLVDELEGLRSQFKAYQRVKAREVSSLDHRVRILLHSQAVAGTMRPEDMPTSDKPTAPRYASWHSLQCVNNRSNTCLSERYARGDIWCTCFGNSLSLMLLTCVV